MKRHRAAEHGTQDERRKHMKSVINEIKTVKAIHVLAAVGTMWLVCEVASICLRALGVG